MGRKMNLSHLTEEECEQILKVIQKDFDLRQVEKDRLACIETKVKEEDSRVNILASRHDFNDSYCLICFKKFLFIFVPKTQCAFCKYYMCKNCISFDSQLKANICLNCHEYHEFLLQSNSWFYKRIGEKFKRFGSAKVVRSLYKRKTDSDAESDSGYQQSFRENVCLSESAVKRSRPNLSKVFELDEMNASSATKDDEPVKTLSQYKYNLEAIERQIKKRFVENRGQLGRNPSDEETMKQQKFNISLILSSMVNDLTSHLDETSFNSATSQFRDPNFRSSASKDAISKCVLQQSIGHIYESSVYGDDAYPFGIDPDELTLRNYIDQLSAAILAKFSIDLQSSEDKAFQEEEEKVRKELIKLSNRARMSQLGRQLSDSELEDFQLTTDSTSDADGREWQTRNSADGVSGSSVSRWEAPASASSPAEDPWTLSERGPATMMSNRIPIAPYDNYGKKKCGPADAEGEMKMFLPKRHSIDGPMIDSINVYELSDLSDGSAGSPFEESHLALLPEKAPLIETDQPLNTEAHYEVTIDDEAPPVKPWFASAPENATVRRNESVTISCRLEGSKPIDVFWYRDGNELVQLGSDERHAMFHKGSVYNLSISNCLMSDDGFYICIGVNEHGSCQHRFAVNVQGGKIVAGAPTSENVPLHSESRNETKQHGLQETERNSCVSEITTSEPAAHDQISVRKEQVNWMGNTENGNKASHIDDEYNQITLTGSETTEPKILKTENKNLNAGKAEVTEMILEENNTKKMKEGTRDLPYKGRQKSDLGKVNDDYELSQASNRYWDTEAVESEVNKNSPSHKYRQKLEDVKDDKDATSSLLSSDISREKWDFDIETSHTMDLNKTKEVDTDKDYLKKHLSSSARHSRPDESQVRKDAEVPDKSRERGSTTSIQSPFDSTVEGSKQEPEMAKNNLVPKAVSETDKILEPSDDSQTTESVVQFPRSVNYGAQKAEYREPNMAKNNLVPKATSETDKILELSDDSRTTESLVQFPKSVNYGAQKAEYRRSSSDYKAVKMHDPSENKDATTQQRSSDHMSQSWSSQSPASVSDSFDKEWVSFKEAKASLSTKSQESSQEPKKNELEEITLPSVKLLRLKFSAPHDTSAAEDLLRRRSLSKTKSESEENRHQSLEPQPKWKSVEHIPSVFTSPQLPISVVPLQPAPIKPWNHPRSSSVSETSPLYPSMPEAKFQKQVIIRPMIAKESQRQKNTEEFNQTPVREAHTVTGRVTVQPFSSRGHRAMSENRSTESRDQKR